MSYSTSSEIQQVLQLINYGRTEEAKQLLGQVLKSESLDANAWYAASLLTSDYVRKVQSLEKAIALDSNHVGASIEWARLKSTPPANADWFEYVLADTISAKTAHPNSPYVQYSSSNSYTATTSNKITKNSQAMILSGVIIFAVALIAIIGFMVVSSKPETPRPAVQLNLTPQPTEIIVLLPTNTPVPPYYVIPTATKIPYNDDFTVTVSPKSDSGTPTPTKGKTGK